MNGSDPAGDVLSGSGRLSLIENGATFDRAGVAFSDVSGARLPAAASERHAELAGQPFRAMGTSCVVHPVNPYAPTSHANVRLFTARGGEVWWFGGGFDLTPVYPFDEDARAWHEAARAACAPAGPRAYALLKDACDKYFYLPHRDETRGIGGLFADDLNTATAEIGGSFEHCFALIRRIGDAYLDSLHAHRAAARLHVLLVRVNRISSACAAGATWNSTWHSIAARASGCSRRRVPNLCSCRCHRAPNGAMTIVRSRERRRPGSPNT